MILFGCATIGSFRSLCWGWSGWWPPTSCLWWIWIVLLFPFIAPWRRNRTIRQEGPELRTNFPMQVDDNFYPYSQRWEQLCEDRSRRRRGERPWRWWIFRSEVRRQNCIPEAEEPPQWAWGDKVSIPWWGWNCNFFLFWLFLPICYHLNIDAASR